MRTVTDRPFFVAGPGFRLIGTVTTCDFDRLRGDRSECFRNRV